MHELSLVQELFAQIESVMKEHNAQKIIKICVEIGPFSGIVPDSFLFAFDVLKKEHKAFYECVLKLHIERPVYKCIECNLEFKDLQNLPDVLSPLSGPQCPECKGQTVPCGGADIILKRVEME